MFRAAENGTPFPAADCAHDRTFVNPAEGLGPAEGFVPPREKLVLRPEHVGPEDDKLRLQQCGKSRAAYSPPKVFLTETPHMRGSAGLTERFPICGVKSVTPVPTWLGIQYFSLRMLVPNMAKVSPRSFNV